MKTSLNSASATDIKNRFGDYLHSILTQHQPLLIEKHGKPVAVILEYGDWKKGKNKTDQGSWSDKIKKFSEYLHEKYPKASKFPAVDLVNQAREDEDSE